MSAFEEEKDAGILPVTYENRAQNIADEIFAELRDGTGRLNPFIRGRAAKIALQRFDRRLEEAGPRSRRRESAVKAGLRQAARELDRRWRRRPSPLHAVAVVSALLTFSCVPREQVPVRFNESPVLSPLEWIDVSVAPVRAKWRTLPPLEEWPAPWVLPGAPGKVSRFVRDVYRDASCSLPVRNLCSNTDRNHPTFGPSSLPRNER
jgi:hypothetical protein